VEKRAVKISIEKLFNAVSVLAIAVVRAILANKLKSFRQLLTTGG